MKLLFEILIDLLPIIISTLGLVFVAKHNSRKAFEQEIASSRIEWIQSVRKTTSLIISTAFRTLRAEKGKFALENLNELEGYIELLILYFGPEENLQKNERTNIKSLSTNRGKNESIVLFLQDFSRKISDYSKALDSINEQINKEEIKEKRLIGEMGKNVEFMDYYDEIIDEQGRQHLVGEPVFFPDFEKAYDAQHKKVQELKIKKREKGQSIESDLNELQEIIRIYLKIEWVIAKNAK